MSSYSATRHVATGAEGPCFQKCSESPAGPTFQPAKDVVFQASHGCGCLQFIHPASKRSVTFTVIHCSTTRCFGVSSPSDSNIKLPHCWISISKAWRRGFLEDLGKFENDHRQKTNLRKHPAISSYGFMAYDNSWKDLCFPAVIRTVFPLSFGVDMLFWWDLSCKPVPIDPWSVE